MNLYKFDRQFLSELSNRLNVRASWLNGVKSIRSGMGYFIRVPLILIGRIRQSDSLAVFAFAQTVIRMRRARGSRGLAIWLKANQVILMNYLAGGKPHSCFAGDHVSVTRSGIPRVIPQGHRKILRSRCDRWDHIARLWLSLFGFYRVVDFKGKVKISTIINPGKPFDLNMFSRYIGPFFELLNFDKLSYVWKPLLILKSAPGTTKKLPYSVAAAARQAYSLVNSKLWPCMVEFAKGLGETRWAKLAQQAAEAYVETTAPLGSKPFHLGKLGFKDEPGKVRVFAMVDWWTQTLLEPIHRWIIDNISLLSMDSTLDQTKGAERASFSVRLAHFGASYDLSAATDRLPVSLQEKLVDHLLPGLGSLWREILVGRTYSMGNRKAVQYSVGQPMGAYSSWALLALTHHFLVQVSAWRVGIMHDTTGRYSLFTGYQVLGDDIVIWNDRVAASYLEIMDYLGVGISLAKSIVSKDSVEFAKRFYSGGFDLSPLAFRELDVAISSLDGMALLLSKFRGELPVILLARLRGAGYIARSKIYADIGKLSISMRNLVIWATMPGVSKYSWKKWSQWIGMRSLTTTRPESIDFQILNERLVDSFNGFQADKWDQGGPTFYVEGQPYQAFREGCGSVYRDDNLPGLSKALKHMKCSVFISELNQTIMEKAMVVRDKYQRFVQDFRISNIRMLDWLLPELLGLEQEVASLWKGYRMDVRKEFTRRLFSGKWLRAWHRMNASSLKKPLSKKR